MVDYTNNLLLASFPADDLRRLGPALKPIKLELTKLLFEAGDTIKLAYFPFDAVISLVVILSTGEAIEAAMVGRVGVVGASAPLGERTSISRAIVQHSGTGLSCELDALKSVAMESPAMLSLLIRHEQTIYAQAQQSAACNVSHTVEARLARWLLCARDLSGTEDLPFTQEFLAEMIGVRRTSVSLVAHTLQAAGIIKYSRGRIQIVNRQALEESACECYGAVKTHHANLMQRPVMDPGE